jgi:putative iron-dependent peroxidase
MAPDPTSAPRVVAQPAAAPLTPRRDLPGCHKKPGDENRAILRPFCGDLSGIFRGVEFRNIEASLSCVTGVGSDVWDTLFGALRPAELHRFREIRSGTRHAVSTPGDLLFHIRAKRMDLCFELATQIMARIGNAVSPGYEVYGFRSFDDPDLIGFVDGTVTTEAQELSAGLT